MFFFAVMPKGKVELTGGFLNRMAGYNEDGTEVLHKKGYWYLLEFHQNDTIAGIIQTEPSPVLDIIW